MLKIGPHSRPNKLAIVDGRRAEAKLMRAVRNELTQHVGGRPSATQRIIIDRCATLSLRIHLMDKQEVDSGFMSEKNAREYLAWTACLSRLLKQLGRGVAAREPSLADLMATRSTVSADVAA